MKCDLTHAEFGKVCDVIVQRMGLYFAPERYEMLGRSLVAAANQFGFQNFNSFITWLLTKPLTREETGILASHLTISETYFWREPQVFEALTNTILPGLIHAKNDGNRNLRIWSAGCSTGEEPYSLAIALHKTIPQITGWNITIIGTDINPQAIKKAENAIYSEWSFRNTPPWLKNKYFIPLENQQFKIIPPIRKMVSFKCTNLNEESHKPVTDDLVDIIFCRNVLMYLTPEKISLAAQKFFNTLNEDGWFVVSSCELSSEVFPQFRAVNFPGAIFYKKRKDVFFNPSKSDTGIAMIPSENPGIHPDSFDISQIEFSIDREKHAPIEKPLLAEISPLYAPTPETEINTPDAVAVIRQLADKGMLSDALTQCNTAIDANKMAIGLYYLRASILQELGHSPEAIASLKQSVYIDHNFIMGHFTLASILIKQGHYKQATRYFQNVLELTKDLSGTDILPESDGLSALHIREIILTNMPKISTA